MARVEIEFPGRVDFQVTIPVRITDINYGNHLGHDAIMSFLHDARVQWLQSKGFSEIDVGGCGLIMADTGIVFKNEVFYPATLTVELCATAVSRSSFDLFYRVTREADQAHIATAKTGMVCFDYTRRKVARIPQGFREQCFT